MKRSPMKRNVEKTRAFNDRGRGSLQANPEKTQAFVQRSREAARAREQERRQEPRRAAPAATDAVAAARSRANPPKPADGDSGPRFKRGDFTDGAKVCACCGRGGFFQAHHVVFEQEVRRRKGEKWDPRNALSLHPNPCHYGTAHTGKLPLTALRDENFEFAADLMGSAAYAYLRRRYSGDDPRLDELEKIPAHTRAGANDVRGGR